MIPKIVCWIFGHKYTGKIFTGEYGHAFSSLHGTDISVPIMKEYQLSECVRCGCPKKVINVINK